MIHGGRLGQPVWTRQYVSTVDSRLVPVTVSLYPCARDLLEGSALYRQFFMSHSFPLSDARRGTVWVYGAGVGGSTTEGRIPQPGLRYVLVWSASRPPSDVSIPADARAYYASGGAGHRWGEQVTRAMDRVLP